LPIGLIIFKTQSGLKWAHP